MILTADTHFTSNSADEYRWDLFNELSRLLDRDRDKHLYILGDLTDRRDRHPSDLVNQLIDRFRNLTARGAHVTILMGNHDRPLYAEKPYWSFLSDVPNLSFIRTPTARGKLLLLPWCKDPVTEWADITMELYHCAFCHQTFDGSHMGGNRVHEGNLHVSDVFPANLTIYSGDVHIPQSLGRLHYVGAPHPIKFGDDYRCRVLVVDGQFNLHEDITLHPPAKRNIAIASVDDLRDVMTNRGDAAKVRITIPMERMNEWEHERNAIAQWGKERGVTISGIEPTVELATRSGAPAEDFSDPFDLLAAFAAAEGIDDSVLLSGFELMEEAKGM